MNPRQRLIRKAIYVGLMVPLIVVLAALGMPSTPPGPVRQETNGGMLAQLRTKHHLSMVDLGEVDPTSETLKLATLGMRGVASTILWEKANDYKMRKDWTNLAATLLQITKFQPNFVAVWRFQGWNLAYNVSAEFDDYRDRYHWVVRGIDYLEQGRHYNLKDAILVWDIGWFLSQKIGKSDEKKEFRRLFKEDDDFHGSRALALRDNFLVGKERFKECIEIVDKRGGRMKNSPVLYRSYPAKAQMDYAEAIEKEGTFGEVARAEWKLAADEWHEYGSHDMPTILGRTIRLNDLEDTEKAIEDLVAKLEKLDAGRRQRIYDEKVAALTKEQREALQTPPEERSASQAGLAYQAEAAIAVTHDEVARRVKSENRKEAERLATEITTLDENASCIEGDRQIVNFAYWRTRAKFEQDADALAAREAWFRGDEAFAQGAIQPSLAHYERAIGLFEEILKKYPELIYDDWTADTAIEDFMEIVEGYQKVLRQLNLPLPKDFPLQKVIDAKKGFTHPKSRSDNKLFGIKRIGK